MLRGGGIQVPCAREFAVAAQPVAGIGLPGRWHSQWTRATGTPAPCALTEGRHHPTHIPATTATWVTATCIGTARLRTAGRCVWAQGANTDAFGECFTSLALSLPYSCAERPAMPMYIK